MKIDDAIKIVEEEAQVLVALKRPIIINDLLIVFQMIRKRWEDELPDEEETLPYNSLDEMCKSTPKEEYPVCEVCGKETAMYDGWAHKRDPLTNEKLGCMQRITACATCAPKHLNGWKSSGF